MENYCKYHTMFEKLTLGRWWGYMRAEEGLIADRLTQMINELEYYKGD